MKNRGRSEVDIRGIPKIAHNSTENPAVVKLDTEVKWHYCYGYQDVGECERYHKVVCDHSQFPEILQFN